MYIKYHYAFESDIDWKYSQISNQSYYNLSNSSGINDYMMIIRPIVKIATNKQKLINYSNVILLNV